MATLTALTKKSSSHFLCNINIEEALSELKWCFTSAPVLVLEDPALPSVWRCRLQRWVLERWCFTSHLTAKLYQWAFLSHWFHGMAQQLFTVWTGHKNLKYIKQTKRPGGLCFQKMPFLAISATRSPIISHKSHHFIPTIPNMESGTQGFVATCTTCAQSKDSQKCPQGLLHQIKWPWFHVSLDFTTGLLT